MSTASTASPSVVRSTSRRQPPPSYNPPVQERPQRTLSSASKPPTSPSGTHRSTSQSQRNTPASSQAATLVGVARRDHETTNLVQHSSSTRRSSSREQHTDGTPRRSESTRDSRRPPSRPGHSRTNSRISDATTLPNEPALQVPAAARPADTGSGSGNTGTVKRRTTIGAQTGEWSLGKTIGAGSMGKVKLAKNLETGEQVAVKIVPRQSTDEHRNDRDRERADHSKEVRTAREAAIVTLLRHPYICAMRDVVRTNYHWYMLFEYVNGGQMLDYIISHGKLKEKQARKFGRQIASALDYCHRNSIVHRDLKIENILISKTGDIKIIDFGLSNLFSPRNHLKTFCGSLYFAAPELLQARQYTGPEVDIWSFGIVLYVLVCGKVPFDDQSMPQLHAKIKKGMVDYPTWLSPECKNLISRMLVTDPRQRAGLSEIMNHPWMTKGFNSPPENFLPHREPLQLPLDPQIVDKMTGFDFGSAEFINRELTKVLNSDDYQRAVQLNAREQAAHAAGNEKKRGVFDFYKRRNSTTSRDTLPNISSEAIQLGLDPVNAFSPLISIYYLVREKQERERMESNPGALSIPMSPGEKPLKIPDLPAPEAAYTNHHTQEMPGERATGGRTRARSRTQGEDDVTDGLKKVNLNVPPGTAPSIVTPPLEQTAHMKKESSSPMGILRRFSTRRGRDSRPDRAEPSQQQGPSLQLAPPSSDTPITNTLRKSFSVRKSRNRDATPTPLHPGGSTPHHSIANQPELLTPTAGPDARSRTSQTLDRSTSVNSADYRKRHSRRGVSEGQAAIASAGLDAPLTSGSDRSSISGEKRKPTLELQPPPDQTSSLNARGPANRAKSLGHARRESMQTRRAMRREEGVGREANVPEEADEELAAAQESPNKSAENIKPVYLKGLFSVSTTSNKPLPVIRADIIRVLKQLGVSYTEIKGGFSCRHAPSIDLAREKDGPPSPDMFNSPPTNSNRRRISFAGNFSKPTPPPEENEKSSVPRKSHRHQAGLNDNSFTDPSGSDSDAAGPRRSMQIPTSRTVQPPPVGETTTHVQNDLGGDMVLLFEIMIVRVPWFRLHGIQFKKVQGGTWQYKDVAGEILNTLNL